MLAQCTSHTYVYSLLLILSIIIAAILSNTEVNNILSLSASRYRSWKSIGLELGIDGAALDAIDKNHVNDHRRLIAMIELWHSSVDLKPSHEAMIKALQSNRVITSLVGKHSLQCMHALGGSLNLTCNYC